MSDSSVRSVDASQPFREEGRLAELTPMSSLKSYALAGDMVALGQLETARDMVETLDMRVSKPGFQALRHMLLKMPPPVPAAAGFMDRPEQDVQIVKRPGATRAVFVFCGHAQRIGVPLNLFHRWLAPLGTHIVYLRDVRRLFYLAGIRSVGGTIEALPGFVQSIALELGAETVAIVGNSGGTYAALRTGLAVNAAAILGIAGPNSLERIVSDIRRRASAAGLDIEATLARATPIPTDQPLPPTRLLYAEGNEADAWQARRLESTRNVELHAVADWPHHAILGPLAESGRLAEHLVWLCHEGVRK